MVTFSKKAQAAGYFFRDAALRPNKAYRQFNTWMGDPSKAIIMRAILEEIEQHDLVARTAQIGQYLYAGLASLGQKVPDQILNLRGKDRGTFIAFDSPRRDDVVRRCKHKGVNIGVSGERAIRLRPMLIFEKRHGKFPLSVCVSLSVCLSLCVCVCEIRNSIH